MNSSQKTFWQQSHTHDTCFLVQQLPHYKWPKVQQQRDIPFFLIFTVSHRIIMPVSWHLPVPDQNWCTCHSSDSILKVKGPGAWQLRASEVMKVRSLPCNYLPYTTILPAKQYGWTFNIQTSSLILQPFQPPPGSIFWKAETPLWDEVGQSAYIYTGCISCDLTESSSSYPFLP